MRISTSTAVLHPGVLPHPSYELEQIPALIRDAGFDSLDWSLWHFCLHDNRRFEGFMNAPDWEKRIHGLRAADEAAGLPCAQTHCVSVNTQTYESLDHAQLRVLEERCLIASGILGAKWMVIHPFAPAGMKGEAAIRFFCEYLKPLQALAHRHQVGIAVENMILRGEYRFCSHAGELAALVDAIDDPLVGCCWDAGHGHLSGESQDAAIAMLGSRVKALHIDDNFGHGADHHLLPYEGTIDWDAVLGALAKVGYRNDFAFEHALAPLPASVMPQQLRYMRCLGQAMLRAIPAPHPGSAR